MSELKKLLESTEQSKKSEKPVYYYLCQKIRNAKGTEYSQDENYLYALLFAKNIVRKLRNHINIYSPGLTTIPMAMNLKLDESAECRRLYFDLDQQIINFMRQRGILKWIIPDDWYESEGCKDEIFNALHHKEEIIPLHVLLKRYVPTNELNITPIDDDEGVDHE